jgi:hypothetical protein
VQSDQEEAMLRSKTIVAGEAALALTAGGVAIADAAGGTGTQATGAAGHRLHRGLARGRLTHADVHLFVKGHDLALRIDRGVLQTIGSGSVTLHELDGSDVTVPIDSSTRVMKMGRPATVSDLRAGAPDLRAGAARVAREPRAGRRRVAGPGPGRGT